MRLFSIPPPTLLAGFLAVLIEASIHGTVACSHLRPRNH